MTDFTIDEFSPTFEGTISAYQRVNLGLSIPAQEASQVCFPSQEMDKKFIPFFGTENENPDDPSSSSSSSSETLSTSSKSLVPPTNMKNNDSTTIVSAESHTKSHQNRTSAKIMSELTKNASNSRFDNLQNQHRAIWIYS
jgi:hypothetical protein